MMGAKNTTRTTVTAGDPLAEHRRPERFRLLAVGGAALSFCAGMTNVQAVLGGLRHPATHVTGTLTSLPPAFLHRDSVQIRVLLSLGAGFLLGAAISGASLESTELRVGRRYGAHLVASGLLLGVGGLLIESEHLAIGGAIIAMAAGIQNGMATHLSAAVVRTTHMTGVVTDLGIALGKAVAGRPVTGWRVTLYLCLLVGFVGGGAVGAVLYDYFSSIGFFVAAALLTTLGVAYWAWRARSLEVSADKSRGTR